MNNRLTDTIYKVITADSTTQANRQDQQLVATDSIGTHRMRQLNESMKIYNDLEAREARLKFLPHEDPMKQMRL